MDSILTPRAVLPAMATALLIGVSQARSWVDTDKGNIDIRFRGTSTLHDFEGSAAAQTLDLEVREDPRTRQTVINASVNIRVGDMTTNHRKRDNNMYKMLDLSHFGLIEGSLERTVVPAEGEGPVEVLLKIREHRQAVNATLSDWNEEGDVISFRLAFPVSLKAFGLRAPSVLGLIRVGDEVRVECAVQQDTRTAQVLVPASEIR